MLKVGAPRTHRFIPYMNKGLLHAGLSIVEVAGKPVQSKAAIVQVDKISMKGFRFLSDLVFPVNSHIVFNFRVSILNETIDLKGTINWSQRANILNVYEVVLLVDDVTKSKLVFMLSNFATQFMPLHLKAEYYYHYFAESTYRFKNNRINLLF